MVRNKTEKSKWRQTVLTRKANNAIGFTFCQAVKILPNMTITACNSPRYVQAKLKWGDHNKLQVTTLTTNEPT